MSEFLKVAHRGASGHAPENTLKAFEMAKQLQANAIELDVQLCGSGEPVVIHDTTLERTTKGSGPVNKHSAGVLNSLGVPTLVQALDTIGPDLKVFIDMKTPDCADKVADIADYFIRQKGRHFSDFILITHLRQLLVRVHQRFPKIQLGVGLRDKPDSLAAVAEFTHSSFICPDINILDHDLMADAKKRKVRVVTWTCNEAEDIRKAKMLEVDGIMTDFPDKV